VCVGDRNHTHTFPIGSFIFIEFSLLIYLEIILFDRTGGTNCIRCFELTLRSLNVVQIHTEGLDKCYTTEEAAKATCPTDESIATGKSREIMLYSESKQTLPLHLPQFVILCLWMCVLSIVVLYVKFYLLLVSLSWTTSSVCFRYDVFT
jgi:hypothetical protein